MNGSEVYGLANISNITCEAVNLSDYTCADKGLLLPLVCEFTWPIWCRVVLYLLGLVWCFLGVAIVADIFMCSIEKITSHVRTIKVASNDNESGYEEIEVKVWNDTVANLTLMALGSSAPEILLACIEIIGKGFVAGELGPGTIVGSAAFNLFCITGLCVAILPKDETRRIEGMKVFVLTSLFSLFAYIWMVIVLVTITPNKIDLWEAILTLAFFPIMVVLAYCIDQNCFRKELDEDEEGDEESAQPLGYTNKLANFLPWNKKKKKKKVNEDRLRAIVKELKETHSELTEDELLKLATMRFAGEQPKNRLWYRINATKQLGGNPKLLPSSNTKLGAVLEEMRHSDMGLASKASPGKTNQKNAIIEMTATQCAILERDQKVTITVMRYGNMNNTVHCKLETIDGTAEAEKDYIPLKSDIVFGPNETEKSIDVIVIDDDEWEPDEVFFVKLMLDNEIVQDAVLGSKTIQEVTILNDDEPGEFEFEKPSFVYKENVGFAEIPICRLNGCDGKVTVEWSSEDITAVEGRDYKGKKGIIVFESGEVKKNLEILIYNDKKREADESFKLNLDSTDCEGAKLGRLKRTIITIVNDDEFDSMMNRILTSVNLNVDALRVETVTWSEQFRNAMNVNGGDIDGASNLDYFMHFLTFGWKILFAFIPPTSIWKGWLSFCVSLAVIGGLTAIVGDLATIFGCLVGLKDPVTAITFVALGTSLPDLFASKQAATMEKTADNSIGNVTGSNSVNVFLGLGLPWTLACIYWAIKGKPFEVEAGSLSFSVMVYVILAIISLSILVIRRYVGFLGKAELGGPTVAKYVTACIFVSMWLIYVVLSSLMAYDHINPPF